MRSAKPAAIAGAVAVALPMTSPAVAAPSMPPQPPHATLGGALSGLPAVMARFGYALSQKQVDGVMAVYAPDVVAYDVSRGVTYHGVSEYRQDWQDRIARYHGLTTTSGDAGTIYAAGDIAWIYGLWRIDSHDAAGREIEDTARATYVLRRIDGVWRIADETVAWRDAPSLQLARATPQPGSGRQ
jgi:ketosteroid isomerase-like protein